MPSPDGGRSRPRNCLRALLLQAFYPVYSERQLMEQLDYNLLFRWFVGLSLDAAVWDVTVFTKNRERLIEGDIAAQFMAAVLNQERVKALLSDEHFSGGRHADRGLGKHEELSPEGRQRRTGGAGSQRGADLAPMIKRKKRGNNPAGHCREAVPPGQA
jgi:hypothetical protein